MVKKRGEVNGGFNNSAGNENVGTIEVPVYGHNIGNEDRIEVPVNVDDEEDSEEDFNTDGRRRVRDLQDSGDESDKDKEIYESDIMMLPLQDQLLLYPLQGLFLICILEIQVL
ncbi:hypothetical protein ACE6H2_006751 [Prunus campanulata]